MTRFACLTAVLLLGTAITGCTSSQSADALAPNATPLATAESFVAALNDSDAEALKAVFTEKARAGLDSGAGMTFEGQTLERPVYDRAIVDGVTARITVTAKREGKIEDLTLHMRRESEEWRIHALEVHVPNQGSMKLDLEQIGEFAERMATQMAEGIQQAFADAQREQEERDKRIFEESFDGLRAMSVDEFEAAWRAPRVPTTNVRIAVDALARSVGLPVRWGTMASRANVPVTVDITGDDLSTLAAIDRLLGQVGAHGIYPDPHSVEMLPESLAARSPAMPTTMASVADGAPASVPNAEPSADVAAIEVRVGNAPFPVVHVGPFRCTVSEVTQDPRYATGTVTVETRAYGLDPAIAVATGGMTETLAFDAVTGDAGQELRADPDVHYLGGGGTVRAIGDAVTLELAGLLRDVPRIATISAHQRVHVPTRIETCTIDDLTQGTTGRVGDLTWTIESAGNSTTIAFAGEKDVLEKLAVHAFPRDASGDAVLVDYQSTSSWGGKTAQYQLQCREVPASIEMKCVLAQETLEFPFALEGIALPEAARAPVSLEKLSFEGAAPVTVRFLELAKTDTDFPTVKLRLTSTANKDVGTIRCRFEYLDRAGKKIEDFPQTLDAPASFDASGSFSRTNALVAAGETVSHEATAFFFPEGTEKVRVVLEAVEFLDGAEWAQE